MRLRSAALIQIVSRPSFRLALERLPSLSSSLIQQRSYGGRSSYFINTSTNESHPVLQEVISRKEAEERGLVRYFTGKPCKRGHITERYTNGGNCDDCQREEQKRARRPRRDERGSSIPRKYGISLAEWEAMFDQQGRACAICRTTEPGKLYWNTDHCHETGIVRGILCSRCNHGLGLFKDRVVNLSSGITYLERTGRRRRETVRTRPFMWDVLKARQSQHTSFLSSTSDK
jgi:hypothetical protein